MKHIFQHPPEKLTGRKYWRSLGEFADTPEFNGWLEREFPAGAAEMKLDGVSRRNFLKLMGASTALAGFSLAACRHPKNLVPFTKSSEWTIPGKPLFYATSMPRRSGAMPLVVTTHDGRPTKIEGNPHHPAGKGATDGFAQASILDLYDPDRSRFFEEKGKHSDAKQFEAYLDNLIAEAGDGSGIAFLLEESNSQTRERLRKEIAKRFPQAKWAVYEPLGSDLSEAASAASFGPGIKAVPVFEKADIVLTLDCDFLAGEMTSLADVRAFADRRRVEKAGDKMNRLYTVENRYTVTGGAADHRLRLPASQIGLFALALAKELGVNVDGIATPEGKVDFSPEWVKEAAADLKSAHGRSLVLVGPRQPVAVQQLGAAINNALGSFGETLVGARIPVAPALTILDLAEAIKQKTVKTLFILGGNPVYNAPVNLGWATLQKSVPEVVRLSLWVDETSQHSRWQVPGAHYLETWNDGIAGEGSYTPVQPMILPLYDGWSELDILAKFAGLKKPSGAELVQETFRQRVKPSDFTAAWSKFLHDGFAAQRKESIALNYTGALPKDGFSAPAGPGNFEVVFPADSKMEDGRYNNNGWMLELPDPITKTTWDNTAWISPKTAKELEIGYIPHKSEHEVIELSVGDRKVQVPVFIAPGHADNSISLSLGWGRKVVGKLGQGTGVDAYSLRTIDSPYFALGAKITKLNKKVVIAHTQEHFSMEGRELVREATLAEFDAKPDFVKTMGGDSHVPPGPPSLYTHPELDSPNQWGMAIDLNTCIGCAACTVACQAENNTPVVGKEQVINGRSMHWMRNDRYFVSDSEYHEDLGEFPSDPQMVAQPMLCQHCENAPCETVCPVNATIHSNDGLNVMAYNRCIGTRYCANNCPFKVRRFNFFDYNQRPITPVKVPLLGEVNGLKLGPLAPKGMADTLKMQKNPNVTVRMRGVMEKCTFCVQRVQEARIAQKVKAGASDNVTIPPDVFTSACAQVCPTGAIVFGDVKNPESRVSKLKEQEKNYRLLEYLNVRTRVSYLARLRNPNPKMPDAKKSVAHGAAEPAHS